MFFLTDGFPGASSAERGMRAGLCLGRGVESPVLGGGSKRQSTRAPVLLTGACSWVPEGCWTPSAAPWGPDPGKAALPPVCECGPASLSLGRGCAPGLDASGVARALGLVSSLTPLSLGPAGCTVYFILLFFSEGAKAATRTGT